MDRPTPDDGHATREASSVEDFQDAFARIEREVDAGNTDLSALGFWRLVRKVKAEQRLAHHWADVIGRIDAKAFRARVRPTFPVWFGNLVLAVASGALVAVFVLVLDAATARPCRDVFTATVLSVCVAPPRALFGIVLVAVAGGLSASLHDLAHWVAGRLLGIRFARYFLDGPLRIQPGLKTDYATYLRAEPSSRAVMHAAGALVSKAAPFTVLGIAVLADAEYLPAWSLWTVLALGVVQIVTDLVWSTKKSDWKRVRRERAIAMAQDAARV